MSMFPGPGVPSPQELVTQARQLEQSMDHRGALAAFEQAFQAQEPTDDVLFEAALSARHAGAIARSAELVERAIALNPSHPDYNTLKAALLQQFGRPHDALAAIDMALQTSPAHVPALCAKADLLRLTGRAQEAHDLLSTQVEAGVDHPWLLGSFASACAATGRYAQGIDTLRTIVDRPDLPSLARSEWLIKLASLLDRSGDADRAFASLQEGNSLKGAQFDPSDIEARAQNVIDTWTPQRLGGLARNRAGSDVPVFIVGMPSGRRSTAEQIIALHPSAASAGERTVMGHAYMELLGRPGAPGEEAAMRNLDVRTLESRAEADVEALRASFPEAERVVDSFLTNFWYLGFIELLHPKARVVHLQMHPLDACLNYFFHDFGHPSIQGASYDLDHIARVYRVYHTLMRHWTEASSLDIYPLDHEQLTADPAAQAAALLDFVGLDQHERCVPPPQALAPSRWRQYQTHLAPLGERLADLIES